LEEVGVMHRGRAEDGGQDKAVFGIHGRMFLESKVRLLVFDGPVAFEITRELQRARPVTNLNYGLCISAH
jgi:hypothetical protein